MVERGVRIHISFKLALAPPLSFNLVVVSACLGRWRWPAPFLLRGRGTFPSLQGEHSTLPLFLRIYGYICIERERETKRERGSRERGRHIHRL